MVSQPKRRRFSVAEYDRMVETGVLSEDERLELIDGVIVEMNPIGTRHVRAVWYVQRSFERLDVEDLAVLYVQNPIHLGGDYEPQPDVVLLRPRPGGYDELPVPADVLLIVEVADASLDHDRRKAPIYAAAGIPEYWLVDVGSTSSTVTVYCEPQLDGYRTIQVVRAGDPLAPLAFPNLAIDTAALLR